MFNVFNEDGLHIGEVKVDINPITAQRTGTLETYLLQAEEYLESIRQEREQELTQQIQTQGEMEKEEVEVTLMVCAKTDGVCLSGRCGTIFPPQEEHLHTSMLYSSFIISAALRFFNAEIYFLHPSRFLQCAIFLLLFRHDSKP